MHRLCAEFSRKLSLASGTRNLEGFDTSNRRNDESKLPTYYQVSWVMHLQTMT